MTQISSKRPSIQASDGHIVPAILVSNNSKKLVILSHGITTGKEEDGIYTRFAETVLTPAYDSLRFDFRGHGESALPKDQVTIAGEMLDFMAVVKWAQDHGYHTLYNVASSFGASITLLCSARFGFKQFSAMAFWNPVISYINTFIEPTVPWAKEFFDQEDDTELAFRNGVRIPETDFTIGPKMLMELLSLHPETITWPSSIPLLVAHGDQDSAVPHRDAADYCSRNRNCVLLTIKGADHGFDDKIDAVYKETLTWLNTH